MPVPQAAATLPVVGSVGQGDGPAWLHLRSGGVSLLLQIFPSRLPAVLAEEIPVESEAVFFVSPSGFERG